MRARACNKIKVKYRKGLAQEKILTRTHTSKGAHTHITRKIRCSQFDSYDHQIAVILFSPLLVYNETFQFLTPHNKCHASRCAHIRGSHNYFLWLILSQLAQARIGWCYFYVGLSKMSGNTHEMMECKGDKKKTWQLWSFTPAQSWLWYTTLRTYIFPAEVFLAQEISVLPLPEKKKGFWLSCSVLN